MTEKVSQGKIVKVAGPLVVAEGMQEADMFDVVRVGEQGLIGEIIEMRDGAASIQVYEETAGVKPGAPVVTTGVPLSVELGPGLIETIYDGIQRPLEELLKRYGSNITRGVQAPALNREKKWEFVPTVKAGDKVQIMGFGTFEVKERAAHTGRNPATGEAIEIAASKTPVFKAGKTLREML